MTDTRFKKGQVPWNKTEHIEKICKCGKVFSVRPSWNRVKSCSISCGQKGKISSEHQKQVASVIHKGNTYRLGKTAWNKGIKHLAITGIKHYNWKGGSKHGERVRFRDTMQAKIFARDNYTCQICDQYSGVLHVDHIKRWSEYPELRFEESNCRTLCMACHYYVTFKRKMPEGIVWGSGLSRRIK